MPCSLLRYLLARRGDLVWNALVLAAVFAPLGGLSLDVPRYFLLRTTLATAADAAAAAAAQCVDTIHFQNTGETRLLPTCAAAEAGDAFAANVANLDAASYRPRLAGLTIDEGRDEVTVRSEGDLRLIFGLTPAFTVQVEARSLYRMISR